MFMSLLSLLLKWKNYSLLLILFIKNFLFQYLKYKIHFQNFKIKYISTFLYFKSTNLIKYRGKYVIKMSTNLLKFISFV